MSYDPATSGWRCASTCSSITRNRLRKWATTVAIYFLRRPGPARYQFQSRELVGPDCFGQGGANRLPQAGSRHGLRDVSQYPEDVEGRYLIKDAALATIAKEDK